MPIDPSATPANASRAASMAESRKMSAPAVGSPQHDAIRLDADDPVEFPVDPSPVRQIDRDIDRRSIAPRPNSPEMCACAIDAGQDHGVRPGGIAAGLGGQNEQRSHIKDHPSRRRVEQHLANDISHAGRPRKCPNVMVNRSLISLGAA